MKNLLYGLGIAGAVLAAGCAKEKTEAELLGYKGEDIQFSSGTNFVITSGGVTNWVPERVLSVIEKYDLSADEQRIVKDFGILMPGAEYDSFPGFSRESEEPWFVWWSKEVESFGMKGKTGILSHYNEDTKKWETNESYFSSYWSSGKEAAEALAKIREILSAGYNVKKFHEVEGGWIAEYLRLCVTCVVGQRPDGTWSCMLDVRDKCSYGCGPWEPVEDQQARLNRYVFNKESKAWRKKVAQILEDNHKAILKKFEAAGVTGMPDAAGPVQTQDFLHEYSADAMFDDLSQTNDLLTVMASVWPQKLAEVSGALGSTFTGECTTEEKEDYVLKTAQWSSDCHDIRLDVLVVKRPQSVPAEEPVAGQVEQSEKFVTLGRWRVVFREKIITGEVIPPKPVLKK